VDILDAVSYLKIASIRRSRAMADFNETITPRYLLAKYIPDLSRFEPKNIGIIVWSPYGIKSRFLAEKPSSPGEVDGRSIPSFITSPSAYRQWINFWNKEVHKPVLEPVNGGELVSVENPQVIEILKQTGRDNFILEDGGFLLDAIGAEDIQPFLDYLFSTLVNQPELEEPRDPTLNEISEKIIADSQIRSTPNFYNDYSISVQIGKVEDTVRFSHAYRNGKLSVVQKISISKQIDKNIHSAAWQFEKVRQVGLVEQLEDMLALVYATPEQTADSRTSKLLDVLESVAPVINLYSEQQTFLDWLTSLYKMNRK
jgi:hypothetical protein